MTQTFFAGLEPQGEKMVAQQMAACRKRRVKQANDALYQLGRTYHDGVPLREVDVILSRADLNPLEEMILCGREGRLHEPVGFGYWLALTWYKMESGRYEIVAYLS